MTDINNQTPSKLQIQDIKMSDVNNGKIQENIKNSTYRERIFQTNDFVKKVYGENKSMKFVNSSYNNEWNKATVNKINLKGDTND